MRERSIIVGLFIVSIAFALVGCVAAPPGLTPVTVGTSGSSNTYMQSSDPLVKGTPSDAPETVREQANYFHQDIHQSMAELKDWAFTPPPNLPPHAVAPSYCYRVYQDILCYRQPMQGMEHNLVAYQGTDAAAPPPAMTTSLPTRAADLEQAHRTAASAPVFSQLPADVKEVKSVVQLDANGAPIAAPVDAAHENLPNPSLAPQL